MAGDEDTDARERGASGAGGAGGPAGSEVEVRFTLRIGGRPWQAAVEVPGGASPVSGMLPAVWTIADRVVGRASEDVAESGREVACRAGCGACCRQPVPIAESEAVALDALIRSWPAARRAAVEARFAMAVERLDEAGLLPALRRLAVIDDADERQALGRAYFDLGIPCPFLEAESCSIHPHRPIACREYLVTSDPAHCADPDPENVELVELPVRPSKVLFRMTADGPVDDARPLLLVLALESAAVRRGREPATTPGPVLLERFVRGLAAGGGSGG